MGDTQVVPKVLTYPIGHWSYPAALGIFFWARTEVGTLKAQTDRAASKSFIGRTSNAQFHVSDLQNPCIDEVWA